MKNQCLKPNIIMIELEKQAYENNNLKEFQDEAKQCIKRLTKIAQTNKKNMKEYVLDRYRNGELMAMGARVDANSIEDAVEKAKILFPNDPRVNFKERLK